MDRRSFIQLAGKAGVAMLLLRCPGSLLAMPPNTAGYQKQLELINRVRDMAYSLGMNIGNDFYTGWNKEIDSFYYCLYVSMPDKIKPSTSEESVKWYDKAGIVDTAYGKDGLPKLLETQNKYNGEGYHTMLYRTAANNSAWLTTILLNYPLETISFITLHEATHRHIRSQQKFIPYIFEEACADVVGNHASIELAKHGNQYFSVQSAKNQMFCMEKIDKCINNASEKYTNREYLSADDLYKNCHDEIVMYLPKGNQFFVDRYDYPVNNAYFLRYKNYSYYYFLLDKALKKMGIDEFIPFINLLPTDEQETRKLLEIVGR